MPRTKRILATDLTLADIKQLLVAKEKLVGLEEKRARLQAELAAVEAAIRKLASGAPAKAGRKPARKKPARQKAGRKPGRPAAAAAARQKGGRRKVAKGGARAKGTLQDVVVALIRKRGEPMAFQDILKAITTQRLVKTRSKDFANVLRRTLSTSTAVKRVARGTYGVAG